MCMFSQPVLSVNNTQIFARLDGKGKQFLAYQMNYESEVENAMILPVPIAQPSTGQNLKFIDLKNYDNFFAHLSKGFPHIRRGGIGCSSPKDATRAGSLEVFYVGNYIASFVPTLADFSKLDGRFNLPADTWAKVPAYESYGFAVFQLAAGSLKPHPMAFEFKTKLNDLFFPTIHIHDGEVHTREHFDHVLYLQHAGFDSYVSRYRNSDVLDSATGLVRSRGTAADFCDIQKAKGLIDANLLVHRFWMKGTLPNQDKIVETFGDPVKLSFNFRRWLKFTPWLVPLAAIGWIFHRRSRLKQSQQDSTSQNESI